MVSSDALLASDLAAVFPRPLSVDFWLCMEFDEIDRWFAAAGALLALPELRNRPPKLKCDRWGLAVICWASSAAFKAAATSSSSLSKLGTFLIAGGREPEATDEVEASLLPLLVGTDVASCCDIFCIRASAR